MATLDNWTRTELLFSIRVSYTMPPMVSYGRCSVGSFRLFDDRYTQSPFEDRGWRVYRGPVVFHCPNLHSGHQGERWEFSNDNPSRRSSDDDCLACIDLCLIANFVPSSQGN